MYRLKIAGRLHRARFSLAQMGAPRGFIIDLEGTPYKLQVVKLKRLLRLGVQIPLGVVQLGGLTEQHRLLRPRKLSHKVLFEVVVLECWLDSFSERLFILQDAVEV